MVIRHCREVDRDRTQKLIWHVIIMFFMSDRWSFEVEFLSHIERENLAARIKQSFNLNFVVCRYDASIAAWFSAMHVTVCFIYQSRVRSVVQL